MWRTDLLLIFIPCFEVFEQIEVVTHLNKRGLIGTRHLLRTDLLLYSRSVIALLVSELRVQILHLIVELLFHSFRRR